MEIIDLVGITFVLEALILSEKIRDFRLTNLEQGQVKSLAIELYLSVEKMRNEGEGYMEMGDATNQIISKHLSAIPPEPTAKYYVEFKEEKTLWPWSSFNNEWQKSKNYSGWCWYTWV